MQRVSRHYDIIFFMNQNEKRIEDWDGDEEWVAEKRPVPFATLSVALGLLLSPPLLGWLFGLSTLTRGARWYEPHFLKWLPFYWVIFSYVIHLVLVWPIANLVYPQWRKNGIVRCAVVAFLFSLPLFSFAYYLGTFHMAIDYEELCLVVFPAALIGAVLFEITANGWVTSLFLGLSLFVPLFVLSDLLGPLPGVWNFASSGMSFYWLRTALTLAAVLYVLVWALYQNGIPAAVGIPRRTVTNNG